MYDELELDTQGKETIDTVGTSDTRGNSPSYGTNYQKLGKELMSRDEIAVLDGSKCVLQLRGVRPFLSDKFDLTQHPNYKYTADFDKRYTFDIEKFLNHRMKLKASEEYEVVDADDVPEETAEPETDFPSGPDRSRYHGHYDRDCCHREPDRYSI